MPKEKYVIEKEIDYLKHLQKHGMFNYNVKFKNFYQILSIVLFITISWLIFFSGINMPLFHKLSIFFISILLGIIIVLGYYFKIKCDINEIENNFKKFHKKIVQRYKEIGVDVDSLG